MRVSQIVGKRTIDLNVDIGEGFPHDAELLRFASSANIACGVHAGSRELTLETIDLCEKHRVRVGVHPGYPSPETMGRNRMQPGQERPFLNSLFEQVSWFSEHAKPAYLKPHGGFYNDTAIVLPPGWETARKRGVASDYESGGLYLAQFPGLQSLTMMLRVHRLPLMGLEATAHRAVAERAKQDFIREGFADRGYRRDGTLLPRTEPGAILQDAGQIQEQVLRLAPKVDSICLHGDTPDCLVFAEMVYRTLLNAGYGVGA